MGSHWSPWASNLSPGFLMLLITGMALCQAAGSTRSLCEPLLPFPRALGFYGESLVPSGDWGTTVLRAKGQGAHLEVHHPVWHQGHHDGQDLHQHLEIGNVLLGGKGQAGETSGQAAVGRLDGLCGAMGAADKTAAIATTMTTIIPYLVLLLYHQ